MMTLREARARKLLTVRGLAAAAELSPTTIYQIEHRRTRPRFGSIKAISAALEVEPMQIMEFAQAIREGGAEPATFVDQKGDDEKGESHERIDHQAR
jgi:transcriptional regulator with XRE-family HTH domain